MLANVTSLPTWQSCATCEPTMKKQRSPTRVTPPPSSVPVFMVTLSRMSQSAPTTRRVGLAAICDRLRRRPERSERIDHGARADGRMAGRDGHGRAAGSRRRSTTFGSDDAIGTDRHVLADHRARVDPGGRIDCRHRRRSRQPWRRLRLRRPSGRQPSPRRGTTTCSFSARSWSCDIRSCRRARPACGTSPCRW